MFIYCCIALLQMALYSIRFESKPLNKIQKNWVLSACSDINIIQDRLKLIRLLMIVIAGPNTDISSELGDVNQIFRRCNPIWRRSVCISEPRAYTLYVNIEQKGVCIFTKSQGRILHKLGLVHTDSIAAYRLMTRLMHILIATLEHNNSPNIQWINDMSAGRICPHNENQNTISLHNNLHLQAVLMNLPNVPFTKSHPSEITITVPPSCYEIIIKKE